MKDILVSKLGFSVRLANALERNNIYFLSDLLEFDEEGLKDVRQVGKDSAKEIIKVRDEFILKNPDILESINDVKGRPKKIECPRLIINDAFPQSHGLNIAWITYKNEEGKYRKDVSVEVLNLRGEKLNAVKNNVGSSLNELIQLTADELDEKAGTYVSYYIINFLRENAHIMFDFEVAKESGTKIAIVFPGIGYHCDKPLLYYGKDAAKSLGYDKIINLKYSYENKNIRGNKELMMQAYQSMYAQAKETLRDIDFKAYNKVLFISKSVGTIIATSFAKEMGLNNVKHILYTPLEYTYSFDVKNAIAFIGTADPWSDVSEVIRLSNESNVPITVYDNLNHSLECKYAAKNLGVLVDVMKKTAEFIVG